MTRFRKGVYLLIAVGLAALICAGCATTKEPPAKPAEKADWQFHDIVSMDFVNQYAKIPQTEGVVIIDSRPKKAKYVKGHIATAISIPDSQFAKMTDLLPKDKNTLLIFYCGGPKCKLSHKSARKAEKLGYKNVKVFAGGFPEWKKIPGNTPWISVEYVGKLIDGNEAVLVDSRPKRKKYDKGHIPTAISIPDSQFDKLKGKLPQDKNTILIFYCGGFKCKLSHKSAKKAEKLGYKNAKVFAAGYPAWKKFAGAGETAAPVTVKGGKEEGSIDIAVFEKIVKENPESILLIDVRDPDEFKSGTFKTAVNIPTDDLEKKIKTLPSDKPIVFICSTGARSGEAYYMVLDTRPELEKVYYVEGEITFNKDGTYKIKPAE